MSRHSLAVALLALALVACADGSSSSEVTLVGESDAIAAANYCAKNSGVVEVKVVVDDDSVSVRVPDEEAAVAFEGCVDLQGATVTTEGG